MNLTNKRQADEEPKPARASKRRAAASTPTTRMTRSAYKQLSAKNGVAVELNPGLKNAPKQRKKATHVLSTSVSPSKTCLTDAQQPCTSAKTSSRSGSSMELEMLPATTYVPPHKPSKQHARVPSVIYALSATPDGQNICAPIRMGSAIKVSTNNNSLSVTVTHQDAANPGGPAPVAYMGGAVPLTISYNAKPARVNESRQTQVAQRRAPSGSSLISPLSGPVQPCAPPTPSLLGPAPVVSPGSACSNANGVFEAPARVGWSTLFHQGWMDGFVDHGGVKDMEMDVDYYKAPEDSSAPAVKEATYAVESIEEAEQLFENEMIAQALEQCSELPVVDISVTKSPTDMFHEEMYFSQMTEDEKSQSVEYVAAAADIDAMYWTTGSENTGTSGSSQQGTAESKPSTEQIETPLSSLSKKPKLDFSPSSHGVRKPSAQRAKSFSPLPANLLREKELRAQLIASRKARRLMQNILVRAFDGTLSIASVDRASAMPPSWSSHWQMDEDHYSVEEYDEDTVSY